MTTSTTTFYALLSDTGLRLLAIVFFLLPYYFNPFLEVPNLTNLRRVGRLYRRDLYDAIAIVTALVTIGLSTVYTKLRNWQMTRKERRLKRQIADLLADAIRKLHRQQQELNRALSTLPPNDPGAPRLRERIKEKEESLRVVLTQAVRQQARELVRELGLPYAVEFRQSRDDAQAVS